MAYMEIRDCDSRFEKLEQSRNRGWQEEECNIAKPAANNRIKKQILSSKLSQMCKTPLVQLDDTISYINSDQTPGKSILKKSEEVVGKEIRVKSAHKVHFDDQVYTISYIEVETDGVEVTEIYAPNSDIGLKFPETPIDDPLYGDSDEFISCNQLYYLLQKSNRYLIIDTRQKINYDKSRILSDKSINIPQSEIKPGMLAYHFFKYCQDKHSHELYTHRSPHYVDIVILLDFDTTQESLTSTTGLHVLKDTLKNRDPGTKYNKIKILNGGYQEWLQRYPAFATNPNVDNRITESKNIENEILETIEYPEWVNENEVEITKSKLNNTKASNIDVDEEIKMTPRRSISNKDNNLKSSQKHVNQYMTPNKGFITEIENTILIENVDKKRRSSRKRVAFSEACVACAENKPVLPMTPPSKRNRSKTPS